jgi:hypothetical protein
MRYLNVVHKYIDEIAYLEFFFRSYFLVSALSMFSIKSLLFLVISLHIVFCDFNKWPCIKSSSELVDSESEEINKADCKSSYYFIIFLCDFIYTKYFFYFTFKYLCHQRNLINSHNTIHLWILISLRRFYLKTQTRKVECKGYLWLNWEPMLKKMK